MKAKTKFSLETIARCLLVMAAGISAYLGWQSFGAAGGLAGCADGASCDRVLSSSWSSLFGLPVAILGTAAYVSAAIFGGRNGGAAQPFWIALLIVIPLAAAWFVGVQIFAIGAVCAWCCATHAIASLGALLLLSRCELGCGRSVSPLLGATAAVAMFAALQLIGAGTEDNATTESVVDVYELDATADRESEFLNEVKLLDGEVTFRLDELPVVGVSQPKHVVFALTDYTCPHCRTLHDVLQDAGLALNNQVVILKLPATRNGTDSAMVHRHMLALWKASPEMHWVLERSLVEGRIQASAASVEAEAIRLVGRNKFAEATVRNLPWIKEQIANTRKVQDANREKTGKGTLPQVMVGSELVLGAHTDPNYYVALAEKQFGLTAKRSDSARQEDPKHALERDGTVRLGAVQPGSTVPFTIEFVNQSANPLEISWVNMAANVTLKSFTKDEILPRKKGGLELALQVPDSLTSGEISRTITVNSASGQDPITFRVFASVSGGVAQAELQEPGE